MVEYIVRVYEDRTEWRNKAGLLHRENDPAVEYTNGNRFWFKNNLPHRENGPAYEYGNGKRAWFLDGIQYSELDFNKEIARRKTVPTTCDGKVVEIDGKKYKLQEIS